MIKVEVTATQPPQRGVILVNIDLSSWAEYHTLNRFSDQPLNDEGVATVTLKSLQRDRHR